MSQITIEKYRGIDIEFDTEHEKFQCIISDEKTKESNSFSAIKKFIDEYKKLNAEFKPFFVEIIPGGYRFSKKEKLQIVGIRKDGRFVTQNEQGVQKQLGDYDVKDYMLALEENEQALKDLYALSELEESQKTANNTARKVIVSNMMIVRLSDYQKELKSEIK